MTPATRTFWIAALLLISTIGASKLSQRRFTDSLVAPLDTIPGKLDGWVVSKTEALDARTLEVLLPTSYLARTYEKDNRQLGLFVAYYAVQRAGENMHSPKNCLPGSGWDILRQDSAAIELQGRPVTINKYSIQRLQEHQLVFYWYQSRTRIFASEVFGKPLRTPNRMRLKVNSLRHIWHVNSNAASANRPSIFSFRKTNFIILNYVGSIS